MSLKSSESCKPSLRTSYFLQLFLVQFTFIKVLKITVFLNFKKLLFFELCHVRKVYSKNQNNFATENVKPYSKASTWHQFPERPKFSVCMKIKLF